MHTNTLIIALIALLVGAFGGYVLAGTKDTNSHMMSDGTTMRGASHDMSGEMGAMMAELSGKTGDAFDRAFLSEMIVHHEGAVRMAEAALRDAGHEDLKNMARAIIMAQEAEIAQMKEWKKEWYGE